MGRGKRLLAAEPWPPWVRFWRGTQLGSWACRCARLHGPPVACLPSGVPCPSTNWHIPSCRCPAPPCPALAVSLYGSGWLALWTSVFGVWSGLFYYRTGHFIYPFLGGGLNDLCCDSPACAAAAGSAVRSSGRQRSAAAHSVVHTAAAVAAALSTEQSRALALQTLDGVHCCVTAGPSPPSSDSLAECALAPLCRHAQALRLGCLPGHFLCAVGVLHAVHGSRQVGGAMGCSWVEGGRAGQALREARGGMLL